MKLVNTKTGIELKVGDFVGTFRGEKMMLTGWAEPRHPGSSGRIYVVPVDFPLEYFPGVIDAAFVKEDA